MPNADDHRTPHHHTPSGENAAYAVLLVALVASLAALLNAEDIADWISDFADSIRAGAQR